MHVSSNNTGWQTRERCRRRKSNDEKDLINLVLLRQKKCEVQCLVLFKLLLVLSGTKVCLSSTKREKHVDFQTLAFQLQDHSMGAHSRNNKTQETSFWWCDFGVHAS